MNVGEKIKKLRTAKLMTQSDLVGSEITRNMLSRIENGAANPSLETVCYLASRLNVSPGYLLADKEDERVFIKYNEIVGIKKAFVSEDYRICRDICKRSDISSDDEIQMILSECNLAIAIEEFFNGELRECCAFLDEAVENCGSTLYRTDYTVAAAGVYFRYMRSISATLTSNEIDESEVNIYPAMIDEFCRYACLLERHDNGEDISDAEINMIGRPDSPYVLHLMAVMCMKRGAFSEAHSYLRAVLLSESTVPQPVLYHIFCDLEICCREIGDFKGAYEYSMGKLEILQKLLS